MTAAPVESRAQSHPAEDLATALAGFVCDTPTPLPAPVRQRTRIVLLDSIGVVMASQARRAAGNGPTPRATSEALATWTNAAVAFATYGVAIELDEGCAASRGHPAMHVVPVALAEAARTTVTGESLLEAIALGYEVAARVGAATLVLPSLHPHGTWGTLGATAALARLRQASEETVGAALSLAAGFAPSLPYRMVKEGSPARNLAAGMSQAAGSIALDFAEQGYRPVAGTIEELFGATLASEFNAELALDGLGRDWLLESGYIKSYPACRHVHASLDALVAAIKPGLRPSDVAGLQVQTYERAVVSTGGPPRPQMELGARFSIPFALAVAIVHGNVDPAHFGPPRLTDETVLALADRVNVVSDPGMTAQASTVRRARVQIHLIDGSVLHGEASTAVREQHDLDRQERDVEEKFRLLAASQIGEVNAEKIVQLVGDLESLDSSGVSELASLAFLSPE